MQSELPSKLPPKLPSELPSKLNGALLINKHAGVSSFGIIEILQRQLVDRLQVKRRDLPKIGHGGTLDPFATGLLTVCVGRGVKLARYFLGSAKTYSGVIRFGESTVPGDPTAPVTETSEVRPESLEQLQTLAQKLTLQPYLQMPPMHSAKKKNGRPLYELAHAGLEVEREPKLCQLYSFEIFSYENSRATFRLVCSSGTYVRTLAQDLARMLGTVALLESLHREGAGSLTVENALTSAEVLEQNLPWNELGCWVPFDRLLDSFDQAEATPEEAQALMEGRQKVLFDILKRVKAPAVPPTHRRQDQDNQIAIYCSQSLIAVARKDSGEWGLERVFTADG